MKNNWKKYAAVAMAGILSAGMLTGCGDKKEEAVFDGTRTVATVNGEEIPMGLLSFVVRNEQAYMKAMYEAYGLGAYVSNLWDGPVSEDSDVTYGEQTRSEVLEQVELMYILRSKAADYGVEVTAEDQEKIAAAAAAFMEANDEETIATLGVNEDIMKTYLEMETYFTRLRTPIMEGADHEVSDEQAQMSSFSYVHITAAEEEDAEAVVDDAEENAAEADAEAGETEDAEAAGEEAADAETEGAEADAEEADEAAADAEAEESAEPTKAELEAKENAYAFYEALLADPEADMTELAKTIDDSLYAANGTFQTNLSDEWEDDTATYYNEDMITALRELKEGEITAVIETEDDGYYVARLEKEFDEEATEGERESIISQREQDFYTETTQSWLDEAEITVDEEVLATLKVTDSMVFTTKSAADEAETAEEEIPEADEEEVTVIDEEPSGEELPVIDEEPSGEELPVIDEEPSGEELPVIDEEPSEEEVPVVGEDPAEEETEAE